MPNSSSTTSPGLVTVLVSTEIEVGKKRSGTVVSSTITSKVSSVSCPARSVAVQVTVVEVCSTPVPSNGNSWPPSELVETDAVWAGRPVAGSGSPSAADAHENVAPFRPPTSKDDAV